jgi:hypothetical protein
MGKSGDFRGFQRTREARSFVIKKGISLSFSDLLIPLKSDPESVALSELSYGGIRVYSS